MRRVILESPYQGDIEANVRYARACVRHSLSRRAPDDRMLRQVRPDRCESASSGAL